MKPITRWIVERYQDDTWVPWRDPMQMHIYKYDSLEGCKEDFADYQQDFHYCPQSYRFCEIEIYPERTESHKVLETHEEDS